jgi:DNA polymerase elongation subunit (family B)
MKILTIDIETSPHDAYAWGLWQQNIGLAMLKSPTRVISWSAKWYDEDEVMWASEYHHGREEMIREAYELVNEADVIVGYNSKAFDMKHLSREFIELDLVPPTPYHDVDLLTVVRKNFKFASNKLDYVAGVLLGEHKLSTGGFGLWAACLKGSKKAWNTLVDYNIADVELTERLYDKLKGWITNHPNHALYVEDQDALICRNCGGSHVVSKGQEYSTTGVFAYQRYKCRDCGANLRGRKNMKGTFKKSPQVLK